MRIVHPSLVRSLYQNKRTVGVGTTVSVKPTVARNCSRSMPVFSLGEGSVKVRSGKNVSRLERIKTCWHCVCMCAWGKSCPVSHHLRVSFVGSVVLRRGEEARRAMTSLICATTHVVWFVELGLCG